jgi:hypothetical protein
MAERQTHHPATEENAILLLAAAEELQVDIASVRLEQDGLTAPEKVLDKAFPPKAAPKKTTPKTGKE